MVEDRFESLVRAARQESPPKVNVSRAVMERLEELRADRMRQRVWIVASLVSVAAASAMCVVVFPEWEAFQDPMLALLEPVRMSLR